uniref:Putative Chain length determinant protein involving in lipopolysaccharide biosynthesis n=1 Tax=Magnetococcus massalia (strain MO-1) TaxID=451514 RepID=A0A1S7LM37_MAGMO|nr:putative Chain length determinant protein involving in lipopolysaccharide biosynthesis [Candidatus Magnetococcus massalia]
MTQPTEQTTIIGEEVHLMAIWRLLMDGKWTIIFWVLVGFGALFFTATQMTPIYQSQVLLEPVIEEGQQNSGLLSQVGGIAAMAGINLGGGNATTDAAIAQLKSYNFTERFIEDKGLLPILFAEEWDAKQKRFIPDEDGNIPTLWDGVELFNEDIRAIKVDKKTGLVTLTIEWSDPTLAAAWANELVARINAHLRQTAIEEARKKIAYLNAELARNQIVEVKSAVANLLEVQIKNIMLANVRTEFAFQVLDAAVVPPQKAYVRPRKAIMAALGILIGGFIGIFWVALRDFVHKHG